MEAIVAMRPRLHQLSLLTGHTSASYQQREDAHSNSPDGSESQYPYRVYSIGDELNLALGLTCLRRTCRHFPFCYGGVGIGEPCDLKNRSALSDL